MKDLKKILDLCPDLRSLTIDECKPAVLDIIQRNLKQLERLCIGKDVEFGEVGEYQQQLEASVSSSSSTGIRDIAITVTRPRDYVSIFESNQTTLKTLFLDVWCEPVCRGEVTDKKGWKLLGSACKFPNLQSLHCCADELLCNIVFTPLLQNSPCIRSLSLNLDPIIGLTESFTMAVVNMPSLQSLQIIEGGEGIEQDIEFILEGLASKGETGVSTLEDIRFVQTNFEMTVVVDSIARIQTLRHLEFNDVPSLEREDLIYLCPKLSSHPGIRSISLTRIGCIDNKMLRQLATIQGLERLHLESLSKITHRGLSAFNGSSVKLTIEDCESVEM
ncbi:hypothetical protein BDA99DRAFT_200986 [Phascolomyces articulosus]|uniref:Uncharacterized protein n=1 Tax=Phascolomyces articulosus TaxID=60185 RepID=A0AAD5K522_9FUNG|nr:hypothetical protein BDA99DRAFT_200986 [Phascolomyces articulosus]